MNKFPVSWRQQHKNQGGFTLIEALFAVVVFSLGVLALIGFQASAIRASAQARSRSDATLIINRIMGDIWSGDHSAVGLSAFVASNTAAWNAQAASLLPNSVVTVTAATPTVSVTITWQAPGDSQQHQLSTSTLINGIN